MCLSLPTFNYWRDTLLVRFETYNVEVVPAFQLPGGRYWICDTHNSASYKTTQPWGEAAYIDTINNLTNGNLRPLIRMLKVWQAHCSVPTKASRQNNLIIMLSLGA